MTGHVASSMGNDKMRYLVFINGRWRWRPTKAMRNGGFRLINLSPGTLVSGKPVPSPDDKMRAIRLNEDWDRHRRGLPARHVAAEHRYPPGSIGEAYHRAISLREQDGTTGHEPGSGSRPYTPTAILKRSHQNN